MKKLLPAILLLLSAHAAFCKTYLIHSEKEFNDISRHIKAGDEIMIANGTYPAWALVINTSGTASQPVTIMAETAGKVIFTGDAAQPIFKLTGSYTILSGITFLACNILKADKQAGILAELNNTQHCRITACVFSQNVAKAQFMPLVVVSGHGEYNQVDHCTFTSNIDNQEVQVKITKDAFPEYTLIENNEFRDKNKVSWKVVNGGECVQIGQDPVLLGTLQPKSMVRYNRFIRCSGEAEVISNKSSNNMYLLNYFEDCDGELVMRGGHDCIIDSNIIKGGNSGIRVNGTGHQITHNQISHVKTGIRLMYGMAAGKSEIGFYIAASDCIIKFNRIENAVTGILVGDSKNADWTGKFDTTRYPSRVMQDMAPYNNILSDNTFIATQTNVGTQ
ncbi:chondroitinase-B domain-containing protein [Chitinophaga sp. RAB17]|uniref:chondroitinase-B domain-containing protein n=1 Tax=Chitinophaga sp. RAB17 TaxID=3233049 RepID=UPI003F917CDA